jgi:hypothetical protein
MGSTVRRSTRSRSRAEAEAVVDSWEHLPRKKNVSIDVFGLVYFVEAVGCERVKIGWTRRGNLAQRVAGLQSGCPFPLEVLAAYPGLIIHEHREHRRFKQYRLHCEWFSLSEEILGYLDALVSGANREPLVNQARGTQQDYATAGGQ